MKITEAKLRQIIREELSQDTQLNEMIGGLSQATSSLKKLSVGQGAPRDRQALEKQLVAQQIERSSPTPGDISYEEHTKEFLDALLDAEELGNMTTVDKLYIRALDFLQGHNKALKAS